MRWMLCLFIVLQSADGKERRAKLAELKKQLASESEPARIEAVKGLGALQGDDEALTLLSQKLISDNGPVRIAAAKATARHRTPTAAKALGSSIQPNLSDLNVARAFLSAIADQNMCANIPVLLSLLDNADLSTDVFKALKTIGCPEAASDLVKLLDKAEKEQKKPEKIAGPTPGPMITNPDRNAKLIRMIGPIKEALSILCERSFETAAEWKKWVDGGMPGLKLHEICYCDFAKMTFEIKHGEPKKCKLAPDEKHKDVFIKHSKERQ
jgi:hypothetical protein